MEITINTKYDFGQEVWVWRLMKPVCAKIDRIVWDKGTVMEDYKYHLSCDDNDYYRYEEELFPTEEELMETMGIHTIKINKEEITNGKILECTTPFTSTEGDRYKKDSLICVVRVNRNSAIITRGSQNRRKYNYCVLYREEIANNFRVHKIRIKDKISIDALRISNFDDENKEEKQ